MRNWSLVGFCEFRITYTTVTHHESWIQSHQNIKNETNLTTHDICRKYWSKCPLFRGKQQKHAEIIVKFKTQSVPIETAGLFEIDIYAKIIQMKMKRTNSKKGGQKVTPKGHNLTSSKLGQNMTSRSNSKSGSSTRGSKGSSWVIGGKMKGKSIFDFRKIIDLILIYSLIHLGKYIVVSDGRFVHFNVNLHNFNVYRIALMNDCTAHWRKYRRDCEKWPLHSFLGSGNIGNSMELRSTLFSNVFLLKTQRLRLDAPWNQ